MANNPRLLVVDDEPDICDFVSHVAEGEGFIVTSIHNANQFPLHYSNEFDVIVLDLSMPGMDGIELVRFLAENRSEEEIILMSGFGEGTLRSAHELASVKGLNVTGSLSKPIDIDALEKLLQNHPEHKPRFHSAGSDETPSVEELRQAIRNKDLTVYYQPKIDMTSGAISGVEALARWRHKQKGMIPPGMFIPFAEKHALIDPLTDLVICESLEQMAAWKNEGYSFRVSINISARTLTDLEFPDKFLTNASSYGIKASQVVIEVTESSVIEKLETSLDILTRLRLKGFGLSIDDFGIGYSSMQQLQRVPFSEIKLDRSFVSKVDTVADSRAIVESTIDLARRLGMKVVAEGVETEGVWDILVDLGCDEAQGYLRGRPMSKSDFKIWLEEREVGERLQQAV